MRFTSDDVIKLMNTENSCFLVVDNGDMDGDGNMALIGSIYVNWTIDSINNKVIGHFSAVSVADSMTKKGIGKKLVSAAEDHIHQIAKSLSLSSSSSSSSALEKEEKRGGEAEGGEATKSRREGSWTTKMECGVINLRKDLLLWYGKMGYEVISEFRGDPEVNRIVKEGMEVWLVIIARDLEPL